MPTLEQRDARRQPQHRSSTRSETSQQADHICAAADRVIFGRTIRHDEGDGEHGETDTDAGGVEPQRARLADEWRVLVSDFGDSDARRALDGPPIEYTEGGHSFRRAAAAAADTDASCHSEPGSIGGLGRSAWLEHVRYPNGSGCSATRGTFVSTGLSPMPSAAELHAHDRAPRRPALGGLIRQAATAACLAQPPPPAAAQRQRLRMDEAGLSALDAQERMAAARRTATLNEDLAADAMLRFFSVRTSASFDGPGPTSSGSDHASDISSCRLEACGGRCSGAGTGVAKAEQQQTSEAAALDTPPGATHSLLRSASNNPPASEGLSVGDNAHALDEDSNDMGALKLQVMRHYFVPCVSARSNHSNPWCSRSLVL